MSLFKKMKLIPNDSPNNYTLSSEKSKHSNNQNDDERLINIINSNLDGHTKLEILKKIFDETLEVQPPILNHSSEKKTPISISRKSLTPKTSKRKILQKKPKKIVFSKKKDNFPDIPWKTL